MATYTYPSSMELRLIEQEKIPDLVEDDPIFQEFPIEESQDTRLRWEQKDNYEGLQQVRGINGAPGLVKAVGSKSYDMEPGVYGEFAPIDEARLKTARELGDWSKPISLDSAVGDLQTHLLQRRIDRIRSIIWTLLTSGTFSVARADGQVLHTDTFPLKTFSASTPWTTTATSTPWKDLQSVVLKQRGQSASFQQGKLYLNQKMFNSVLQNTNAADLGGRRGSGSGGGGGSTFNNLADINSLMSSQGLPTLEPYDHGYISDGKDGYTKGEFVPFIPDGKAVLVGKRTNGAKLGAYRMVRNVNNPNMEPGAYTRVIDRGESQIPRTIEVHDGHDGGPVIFFPGSLVVLTIG